MQYGESAPKLGTYELPTIKTETKLNVEAVYTDKTTIDGTLKRKFVKESPTLVKKKYIYEIEISNITYKEYEDLIALDGQEVDFYPHSDDSSNFRAWLDIDFYYRGNKYFRDWCKIKVERKWYLVNKHLI